MELFVLCDRLAIEWHGWLGRKEGSEYYNMTDFNDPSVHTDISGSCNDASCVCRIPHLDLQLPYYYCTLPRILMWTRAACVGHGVRKDHLLEIMIMIGLEVRWYTVSLTTSSS